MVEIQKREEVRAGRGEKERKKINGRDPEERGGESRERRESEKNDY